jgi:hypothetical protein
MKLKKRGDQAGDALGLNGQIDGLRLNRKCIGA